MGGRLQPRIELDKVNKPVLRLLAVQGRATYGDLFAVLIDVSENRKKVERLLAGLQKEAVLPLVVPSLALIDLFISLALRVGHRKLRKYEEVVIVELLRVFNLFTATCKLKVLRQICVQGWNQVCRQVEHPLCKEKTNVLGVQNFLELLVLCR